MLAITDPGVNINLARQATPTMDPVIMDNEMKARIPESTHTTKLQLPDLSKLVRQIHIFLKM